MSGGLAVFPNPSPSIHLPYLQKSAPCSGSSRLPGTIPVKIFEIYVTAELEPIPDIDNAPTFRILL